MVPVKLAVKHWELGPADIGFSIAVTPVSLEEALDERRLKLTLDGQVWGGGEGGRCGGCGHTRLSRGSVGRAPAQVDTGRTGVGGEGGGQVWGVDPVRCGVWGQVWGVLIWRLGAG